MSALPPKADMCSARDHVCYGSKADMCAAISHVRFYPESDRNSRHRGPRRRAEHFCSARLRSNVNLLSNGEGIVHIDAEILNGALYLGVT
jgi:hypothetical protein